MSEGKKPLTAFDARPDAHLEDLTPMMTPMTMTIALKLAREIAAFPQIAMRSDRLSTIRQWGLPEADAIAQEMRMAAEARRLEARDGASRFAADAGRHGSKVEG